MKISALFVTGCIAVMLQTIQCLPEAANDKKDTSFPFGNQKQRNVGNVVEHFGDGVAGRLSPESPPLYQPGKISDKNDAALLDVFPTKIAEEIDGFWMAWSEWSLCSRSCGGGVTMQTRKCKIRSKLQTVACEGPKVTYKLCNTKKCFGDSLSFRELQCSSHNKKQFRYKQFKWVPYSNNGIDSCDLTCMATQFHFYQTFGVALDGTRCGRGGKDMCISGECSKIGCDLIVGSSMQYDACGVCGGNNETCFHYINVFDRLKVNAAENYNYNEVAKIPAGATHVFVKDYNQNFLALMETGGHFERYVVNGNWVVSWPGEFETAGTSVLYQRENDIETFEIDGPTNTDLYIMILYLGHQPQIEYQYWIPNSLRPDFDGYGELRSYQDIAEYNKDHAYDDIEYDGIDQDTSMISTTMTHPTTTVHTTTIRTTPAPSTTLSTTTTSTTTKSPEPSPLVNSNHKPSPIKTTVVRDKPSYCNRCKKPRNRKKYYCESDFAIHARIVSKRRFRHGKRVRFDIEIMTTYKSDFKLMKREYIWVENTCCPKLRPLRSYLLMGKKVKVDITDERRKKRKGVHNPEFVRRYETRLIISHKDYWSGWKKSYERSMSKVSNKLNCENFMARSAKEERQKNARKSN